MWCQIVGDSPRKGDHAGASPVTLTILLRCRLISRTADFESENGGAGAQPRDRAGAAGVRSTEREEREPILLPQPIGAWDCAAWSSPWQGESQAGATPAGSTIFRVASFRLTFNISFEAVTDQADYTTSSLTELAFILVHGTFAPDAEWACCHKRSLVRRSIARHFQTHTISFEPFRWAGPRLLPWFNSAHRHRIRAANELQARIMAIRSMSPNSQIYVIAHSHGGNVVLYALREATVRTHVKGVVLMATPYFTASASPVATNALAAFSGLVVALYAMGGFIFFPPIIAGGLMALGAVVLSSAEELFGKAVASVLGYVLGPLTLASTVVIAVVLPAIWKSCRASVKAVTKNAREQLAQKVHATLSNNVPALCLIAENDEVERLFSALRKMLTIFDSVSAKVVWAVATLSIAGVCCAQVFDLFRAHIFQEPTLASAGWLANGMVYWGLILCWGLTVGVAFVASYIFRAFLIFLLARGRSLVHGRETFLESVFSNLDANPIPVGHESEVVSANSGAGRNLSRFHEVAKYRVTVQRSRFLHREALHHSSIQNHRASLRHILRWLSQLVAVSPPACAACARLAAETASPPPDNDSGTAPGLFEHLDGYSSLPSNRLTR